MPSWNIHIAHVEHLLEEVEGATLGISCVNEFIFGNLVPDVLVGYMVTEPSVRVSYAHTHFAEPTFVPTPNASAFYRRYVAGHAPSDLTVGAWCHLLCDHYYNAATRAYIDSIGVKAGEQTRIRKQADFDQFGRTLEISSVPAVTDSLITACAGFEQYALTEADVRSAVEVTAQIVERNRAEHVGSPAYSLLTPQFFADTFDQVASVLKEAMQAHAAGQDVSRFGSVA